MWSVRRYEPESCQQWDEFVKKSRNATFLFMRGYMDYHCDRFNDCSMMAYKGNRLMAILPANITEDGVIHSHQGLTYGGWILPKAHLDGSDILEIFHSAIQHWKQMGLHALDYKALPYIYATQPSQEDEYALFRLGANLSGCSLSATIDMKCNPGFNKLQRRHLIKNRALDIQIGESADIDAFMSMLKECLADRHNVLPVHTSAEMKLLVERFPENIRFYVVTLRGEMMAGICVYDCGKTVHTQYICTTEEGRRLNLMASLIEFLIHKEYRDREFFDFGISTERDGLYLNEGLLRQKYSYGATGVAYKRFFLEF